jgi:hypothetical protein
MLYGDYWFSCSFETEAHLPPYKGSVFRGVFGLALRRVVCALKRQECPECLLSEKCLYAVVFETARPASPSRKSRIAAPPHPFVIEPPLEPGEHYPPGAGFDFHLLLFGEVNQSLPYFLYAFEEIGRLGIGKRAGGRRGRFRLDRVTAQGREIYAGGKRRLTMTLPPEDLVLGPVGQGHAAPDRITVSLITPLRLKFQNHLSAGLPFHVLVRAALRRVSSLCDTYGDGEPALDYRGLVARAAAVRAVGEDLRWLDWERYSSRQERAMLMGGIVGSVTYEGPLAEYLPLIEFCARVHLGKQTAFGLGKIAWAPAGD